MVSSDAGIDSAAVRDAADDIVAMLRDNPHVATIDSAWTSPAADLVSTDRRAGLIVAGITGTEAEQQTRAREISDAVTRDDDGVTVRTGGTAMVNVQITAQSQRDLLVMEAIAIPLSFLVLVWVFGGLVAAALPVAIGGIAIVGALAVLRVFTFATDVSIFALNLATAMGLALAIDYTLLILSRYRDEVSAGAQRTAAIRRTMVTAGRTVVFSATTVALSMAAMVLFPMHFLKSFAYAGVATVAFAAAAAIIVTPAALVLLGDRIDALDLHRPARRLLRRPEPAPVPVTQRFWYRCAHTVMRRAVPFGLAVVVLLLVLGAPFLGVRWNFRRPGTAAVGVGAPGRRPAARGLHQQHRHRGHRGAARHRRARRRRAVDVRGGAVPRARRGRGVGADRHLRRRGRGRAAVGTGRCARRQRISDRAHHHAAVLRRVGDPTDRLHAVPARTAAPCR